MIRSTILIGSLIAMVGEASAAGWVKPPGDLYFKLSTGVFQTAGYWDLGGRLVEVPDLEYANQSASLYAELGLLPRVAIGFYVPILVSRHTDVFDIEYQRTSLGDLDAFLQVQLIHEGRFALSAQLAVRVPLYEGVLTGVNQQTGWVSESNPAFSAFFPAIGDGSIDFTPTVQLGVSLDPVPGWITAEVGPRLRTRGFGSTLSYALGAGVFVWPERVALTARLGGWKRFSSEHTSPTSELFSFAGGLLAKLAWGFAIDAEVHYIPAGSFVARGGGVTVGVSYSGTLFEDPWK
jgi:hypothetical protein